MLFIARHCKTAWSLENKLQGSMNPPLCKEGRAEALANIPLLAPLNLNRIISSPLRRAIQTARIYANQLHIPVEIHDDLRELHHGAWEGRRLEDLLHGSYALWLKDPSQIPIPGGSETIESAQRRILDATKEITARYPGENILIITHKHIRALLMCAIHKSPIAKFQQYVFDETAPVKLTN